MRGLRFVLHAAKMLCLSIAVFSIITVHLSRSALATDVPVPPAAVAETSALPQGTADWALCRAAAADVSRQAGLPDGLLAAISVTETGIQPRGHTETSPWPWTINAAGRGFRFASKDDAVAATRHLLSLGFQSIDVGCMQVNLRFHPRAFTSLEEAFDPLANATYSATFLTRLHRTHESWERAVRAYHSHDPVDGRAYAQKVNNFWDGEKERQALMRNQAATVLAQHLETVAARRGDSVLASLGHPVARAEHSPTRSLAAIRSAAGHLETPLTTAVLHPSVTLEQAAQRPPGALDWETLMTTDMDASRLALRPALDGHHHAALLN